MPPHTRHFIPLTLLGLVLTAVPALAPAQAAEDSLGDIARANDLSVGQARSILTDPTARVGANDRFYYVEPIPEGPASAAPVPPAAFPLEDTFSLHSKPGSQRTVYLDFNGETVSGTGWNTVDNGNVRSGYHAGWDPSGDGSTSFTNAEKRMVQDIFLRVAEDFAPFDVDVTTSDPGAAAITRTNSADQVYGARALITDSDDAHNSLCGRSCGGVAFVGSYDVVGNDYYQPAWVFPAGLSQDPKNIAEATSHEIGHNLGLLHDGTLSDSYYDGHGGWAPIMGVGYREPISQWSRGEYLGASETQDDLGVINSHGLANRADEAGGTVASAAAALPAGTAYITSRTDIDVYALGQCAGTISLTADPVEVSPNLDIQLTLLNAAGATVASNDPASAGTGRDSATGLNAAINTSVAAGLYYLAVDGVGRGTVNNGYSDYGSLGAYTVSGAACADVEAPGAPRDLTAVRDLADGEVDLTWTAPADDGGSAITRYDVLVDGLVAATSTGTSASVPVDNTPHDLSVRAVNSVGAGPASTTVNLAGVNAPGAPTTVAATRTVDTATITWAPPASTGGSPITGYQVALDDGSWIPAGDAASRTHTFTGVDLDAHELSVGAVNQVGPGTVVTVPVARIGAPTAPLAVAATRNVAAGEVTVTWNPPTSDGGAAVSGYEVQIDGITTTMPATPRTWTTTASHAAHTIVVRARNARGASADSTAVSLAAVNAPGVPRSARTTRTATSITLTWAAPGSTGGSPITGYEVNLDDDGWVPVDRSTQHVFSTDETAHAVAVRALNAVGPGPSATVKVAAQPDDVVIPPTLSAPSQPRIGRAKSGRRGGKATATIRWRPPVSDGGAEIKRYQIFAYKLKGKRTVKRFKKVVSGNKRVQSLRLPRGVYKFAVRAKNSEGKSPFSSRSGKARAR